MIKEKERASHNFLCHLGSLFQELDTGKDGKISWQEFESALAQPRVRHWFAALEIDVSNLPFLFEILDDGDAEISQSEFIAGLKKVKGPAQSIDLLALMKEVQRLKAHIALDRTLKVDTLAVKA